MPETTIPFCVDAGIRDAAACTEYMRAYIAASGDGSGGATVEAPPPGGLNPVATPGPNPQPRPEAPAPALPSWSAMADRYAAMSQGQPAQAPAPALSQPAAPGQGLGLPSIGMGGSISQAAPASLPTPSPPPVSPHAPMPGNLGAQPVLQPGAYDVPLGQGSPSGPAAPTDTGGPPTVPPEMIGQLVQDLSPTSYDVRPGAPGDQDMLMYDQAQQDIRDYMGQGSWLGQSELSPYGLSSLDPSADPMTYAYEYALATGRPNPMTYATMNADVFGQSEPMFSLMNPGQTLPNEGALADFSTGFVDQMTTPGNGYLDPGALYDNLFSPEAIGAFGEPGAVPMQDQVAAVQGSLEALAPYVPGSTMQAVDQRLGQAIMEWQHLVNTGQPISLIEYLTSIGADQWL